MDKKKKVIIGVLAVLLAAGIGYGILHKGNGGEEPNKPIPVNPVAYVIEQNEDGTFSVKDGQGEPTVLVDGKKVEYTIENKDGEQVIVVNPADIGEGDHKIEVQYEDGSGSVDFVVKKEDIAFELNKNALTLHVGESEKIEIAKNETKKNVVWKSGDEKVATVDENGNITAVALGKTVITASAGKAVEQVEVEVVEKEVYIPKDKTAPVINIVDFIIEWGDEPDFSKITAKDDRDGSVKVVISGEYDKYVAGEYAMKAESKDKAGNIAEEEFKVVVKDHPKQGLLDQAVLDARAAEQAIKDAEKALEDAEATLVNKKQAAEDVKATLQGMKDKLVSYQEERKSLEDSCDSLQQAYEKAVNERKNSAEYAAAKAELPSLESEASRLESVIEVTEAELETCEDEERKAVLESYLYECKGKYEVALKQISDDKALIAGMDKAVEDADEARQAEYAKLSAKSEAIGQLQEQIDTFDLETSDNEVKAAEKAAEEARNNVVVKQNELQAAYKVRNELWSEIHRVTITQVGDRFIVHDLDGTVIDEDFRP